MKDKVAILKAAVAIIFAGINSRKSEQGINEIYKYSSTLIEHNGFKGWAFTISIKELGHKERELQVLKFKRPDNIDKFNMEYNVLMTVLSSGLETALMTWNEAGKLLNTDIKLQEIARNVLRENG